MLLLLLLCCVAPFGAATRPQDADGDRVPDAEDCEPTDAERHPGAPEKCNGRDDDCDYLVDEDLPLDTWYADHDDDGHGDAALPLAACARPDGYVSRDDDCDPADRDTHPGARELCDTVDQDCDGDTTDWDDGPGGPWYLDADGDGFGDGEERVGGCVAPAGYVDDPLDCDDTRADVNPAAAEVCDDEDTDEDCDGFADEADDWHAGGEPMYRDQDGDGHGEQDGPLQWRCAPGPGYAISHDDCDDTDAAVFPRQRERCDGVDEDCDGEVDEDAVDALVLAYDGDADGFGTPDRTRVACPGGPPWVPLATDCDDTDATVYPGAPETDCGDPVDRNCDGGVGLVDGDGDGEVACLECDDGDAAVCVACDETCNGRDDDCDGTTDEPDAVDAATWFEDADGDGFGTALHALDACEVPPGYAFAGSDCNDRDAARYPGAPETCRDGVDQDCDGTDAACFGP